jgi:hypothetical protein
MAEPPLCTYKDIIDGTLDLADIATLNDIIDIKIANREIYENWQDRQQGSRRK